MVKKNTNAFTLIELVVVVTILGVLGAIGFMSVSVYGKDANNAKILHDVSSLTSIMEINLAKGANINNLISLDRTSINGVNENSKIISGTYSLKDLKYKVGYFNFKELGINGEDFKYNVVDGEREYLFAYVSSNDKSFYQFAGQIREDSGKNISIIKGTYFSYSLNDTIGLISENGSDIGLKNMDTLTGSLY